MLLRNAWLFGKIMAPADGKPVTLDGIDSILHPLLCSDSEAETEGHLATLVDEHADPIITRIVRKKLRVSLKPSQGHPENQDGLELASELRAGIISELHRIHARKPHKAPVEAERPFTSWPARK